MKKFALICCNETLLGSLSEAFGREGERWDVLMPDAADFAEKARGYDGYVISGSLHSVVDDAASPIVMNLLAFIREQQAHSTAPVLGICFGAQAIAAALGGQVGRNPSGRFKLGVDRLAWNENADPLRWPEIGMPAILAQSHGECVAVLPPESEVLASSATIAHEIFLVQGRFLGIQGHPEVDNRGLREGFMPFHRPLFDAEQWREVESEAEQILERNAVIGLGRRLLVDGCL